MHQTKKLSMAIGAAVLTATLGAAGWAVAAGCNKTATLPTNFPVGSASQRSCNDLSASGRVKVLAIGGTTKTFQVTANLLAALGPGEIPTTTTLSSSNGQFTCAITDNNPASQNPATRTDCVFALSGTGAASFYRLQSGDNAGN